MTGTVSLKELAKHLGDAQQLVTDCQASDEDEPELDFAALRKSARAVLKLLGEEGGGAAGDSERAAAFERARDGEVDHRKDFASGSADSAMAMDRDAKTGIPRRRMTVRERVRLGACPDVGEIFPPAEHPHLNHG